MERYCVLYNPLSANCNGKKLSEKLISMVNGELRFIDITSIPDLAAFVSELPEDERLILTGGDGTLNRFINSVVDTLGNRKVFFYPCGTGNDFWKDIGGKDEDGPLDITKYIFNLPTVTVNGKTTHFINGIGYGIDGYCCEIADQIRARDIKKPINYTTIALKGLLFYYKPTNAVIEVDGVKHEYKKVWLAPGMLGRYFGGGMMPTPDQNRLNKEHTLSCMVFHGTGKIRTLSIFPQIFKGKHIAHKEFCNVFTGHSITVRYNRPVALQIDGETVLNVTEYSIHSNQ